MGIEETIEKHLDDSVSETKEVTPESPKEEKVEEKVEVQEPEFDLGDGKKAKLSEIKEWEKGSLRQSDYTKKTQELAKERDELKQMRELETYLKANPKKLEKVLGILEDREEQKKEVIEGLDDSDPAIKFAKQQNDILMREIQTLKEQITKREQTEQIQNAQKMLNNTLGESVKSLDLNEDEKEVHRRLVLSHLKDNPKDYASEDVFKSEIHDLSKNYYEQLKKLGEAKIKTYLESKKTAEPPAEQTSTLGQTPEKKFSMENLQEDIEKLLEERIK